jgi:hypothetical protein
MKATLQYIDSRASEYNGLPLFSFMRDSGVSLESRLAFVPCMTYFAMAFADVYQLMLREEPANDYYQELVNAHAREDGGHWKWFLADLASLNLDRTERMSEAMRFLWGASTVKSRLLTYKVCRLGYGASSLHKLVLVHCIEAAGKIALGTAAPLGRELGDRIGKPLLYFGAHHFDTEGRHTLEEDKVRASLETESLTNEVRAELYKIVDEVFIAFKELSEELLAFARSRSQTA